MLKFDLWSSVSLLYHVLFSTISINVPPHHHHVLSPICAHSKVWDTNASPHRSFFLPSNTCSGFWFSGPSYRLQVVLVFWARQVWLSCPSSRWCRPCTRAERLAQRCFWRGLGSAGKHQIMGPLNRPPRDRLGQQKPRPSLSDGHTDRAPPNRRSASNWPTDSS